ncbi:hypothetical protein BDN70DRAFT_353181 [Pholiota conissans]|uniref:Uncharacterized protein n=1 Tax=Pholiota conissans TaxID=109636 RepID=A0A9P6CNT1_9AGAR|nr:hypothetical protein BDN70DRAFT_353181 [Pholiota conissans]
MNWSEGEKRFGLSSRTRANRTFPHPSKRSNTSKDFEPCAVSSRPPRTSCGSYSLTQFMHLPLANRAFLIARPILSFGFSPLLRCVNGLAVRRTNTNVSFSLSPLCPAFTWS